MIFRFSVSSFLRFSVAPFLRLFIRSTGKRENGKTEQHHTDMRFFLMKQDKFIVGLFAFLGILCVVSCGPGPEEEVAQILKNMVLYEDVDVYAAWPAVVRTADGDLLVAFTSTEKHIAPDGKIVTIRSSDNGNTWSAPSLVYDSPIDDRESGLTSLRDGRLLAHIWSTHWTREA